MKLKAIRIDQWVHQCPFCEFVNANHPTCTPWCGKCGIEYYQTRYGNTWYDTERSTSAPLAKALWRVGGIRLSDLVKKGDPDAK